MGVNTKKEPENREMQKENNGLLVPSLRMCFYSAGRVKLDRLLARIISVRSDQIFI
jgi:hypothetical protein